jgi:predicted transposase YbfD/YdcC
VHGAIVTIDAMGCQKAIVDQIVKGGGDYVLTAKDNQPNLMADIQALLEKELANNFEGFCQTHSTSDKGHGRLEKRHYTILKNPQGIRNQEEWTGLKVVGMCVRERQVGKAEPTTEVSYFIGSKLMSAKDYGKALRNHWGIENNLHWQLDVSFAEDDNRVAKRNGGENLAMLRRLALMMLMRHPSKESMAGKQWHAAMTPSFLEEVLSANINTGKI